MQSALYLTHEMDLKQLTPNQKAALEQVVKINFCLISLKGFR